MSRELPFEVAVELDASELGERRQVGTLRRVGAGPSAVVAFAYDETWLASRDAFVLDPTHGLYGGDQYPSGGDVAAVFTDAAPDRWGRTLLERREAMRARDEGRRPRSTFAARRFDRATGTRRLYASAMTMTGKRDREDASYLDIALAVADYGARGRIDKDLAQLFRRLVFNVLTSHRDDHLRNHGFLRTPEGWRLAPAFDFNPVPARPEHELTLDGSVRRGDLDAVRETAPFYRLSDEEADAIIEELRAALASWRVEARAAGVGARELDLLDEAITA